jgi:hypothetical protein
MPKNPFNLIIFLVILNKLQFIDFLDNIGHWHEC